MIDHLVYATPDLRATMSDVELALGIAPAIGGRHIGRGTWNALISLAPINSSKPGHYLELIGPDPDQPEPEQPRPFGVDHITEPSLVAWAAQTSNIELLLADAKTSGFDPGPALPMQRETPQGQLLTWQLTFPLLDEFHGLVPFLIDWGSTVHPSLTAPRGASLTAFTATHPTPPSINSVLQSLGVADDVQLSSAMTPALHAIIVSPLGGLNL